MIALAIPLIAFLVLLVTAAGVTRRAVLHPAVVLSSEYLVVAACSVPYTVLNDAWPLFPDNAVTDTAIFALLITASLLPSLLITKPEIDLALIIKHIGRSTVTLAAIAGIVGFICLSPVFLASLSINADDSKRLGLSAAGVAQTQFTVIGSFFSAFSCLYGLLLFSDTRMELSWIERIGLLIGFLNYGVMMEVNKGRESAVYYLFYFVFYLWLFGGKWRRKMKVFFYTCLGCVTVGALLLLSQKTFQRFVVGEANATAFEGTFGYLGQQVLVFTQIADLGESLQGHSEMYFPAYFYLTTGNWPDLIHLIAERKEMVEFSFGTFVGSLYLAIGQRWAVATILVFAVLAGAFFRGLAKRSPGAYMVGIMLYYQTLFQGAFYWMMGGRFGNGFIIVMGCLALALWFWERWVLVLDE